MAEHAKVFAIMAAGADGTSPQGISNTGTVVGLYFDASGNIHGFERTPARP